MPQVQGLEGRHCGCKGAQRIQLIFSGSPVGKMPLAVAPGATDLSSASYKTATSTHQYC
jgi:hypothetical protein